LSLYPEKAVKARTSPNRFYVESGSHLFGQSELHPNTTNGKQNDMITEKRLPHKRLTLLQLTERLRKVSEAGRRQGISRNQFYKYKRGFLEQGECDRETQ
jgi:hypothetical protein